MTTLKFNLKINDKSVIDAAFEQDDTAPVQGVGGAGFGTPALDRDFEDQDQLDLGDEDQELENLLEGLLGDAPDSLDYSGDNDDQAIGGSVADEVISEVEQDISDDPEHAAEIVEGFNVATDEIADMGLISEATRERAESEVENFASDQGFTGGGMGDPRDASDETSPEQLTADAIQKAEQMISDDPSSAQDVVEEFDSEAEGLNMLGVLSTELTQSSEQEISDFAEQNGTSKVKNKRK